ncbi:MAG: hypothetical protein WCT49_04520 [Candidatus Paceibacterota bacterium]|nr:hypothetical protein [Candidatus Paceibacterota bacterium]
MENNNQDQATDDVLENRDTERSAEVAAENKIGLKSIFRNGLIPASILLSSIILSGALVYSANSGNGAQKTNLAGAALDAELEEKVMPPKGVLLPVVWGDLGKKLVDAGVIDADKFKAVYEQRGTFPDEYKDLLLGSKNGKLKITKENSGFLLNLLWALGLGNKNPILEKGEISDPKYGGAEKFASTGGWTISKGNPMDHFSYHTFITLTADQQALVDRVSKGIYRPCCGNSTHFPDCNHGMAMLGLLELMASQGVSEQIMWKTALEVNSYWFPNNYLTIAAYIKNKGTDWEDVNPQEMLGSEYSSSRGNANISSQVAPLRGQQGGGGCGV